MKRRQTKLGSRSLHAQRLKYAIQAGLSDDFVSSTLGIEVDEEVDDFREMFDDLNRYTHFTEKHFDVEGKHAYDFALKALKTLNRLFEVIEERSTSLLRNAERHAHEVLQDVLMNKIIQELSDLATHYSVDEVYMPDLEITEWDARTVKYKGFGTVGCQFQYGPDLDVRRGDGILTDDSYPVTCDFEAAASAPLKLRIISGTLYVDNSSFYK
jgi:hypothetical protein